MTTYIFAIGGTGARVMHSLTMLLAAGCKGGDEIVPIILDYDTGNGNKRDAVKVMERYKKLHDSIYTGVNPDAVDSFFKTSMNKICDKRVPGRANLNSFHQDSGFAAYIPPRDTNTSFSQYLGFGQMVRETLPTREFLKAMYDVSPATINGQDNPRAELNLNLEKGFKGCPNIGCIVTRHFSELPEYKHVLTCFAPGDRIMIVGSVFGGTGASGIPTLLDLLRGDSRTQDAPIAVLAMMPYYEIENNRNGAISSDTFIAKAKAAVTAYQLENSVYQQANDIYFIGDNDKRVPFAYAEGDKEQRNDALFAEFAGAMLILDYIQGNVVSSRGRAHEIGLKDEAPITPAIVENGVTPTMGNILETHFYDTERVRYIDPLTKMVLFEKFCKEYIPDKIEKSDTWYNGCKLEDNEGLINDLHDFAKDLFTWLKELEGESHPIVLYHPDNDYFHFLESKVLVRGGGQLRRKRAFNEGDLDQMICDAYRKYENKLDRIPNYQFIRCAYDAFTEALDCIKNFKN